MTKLFRYLPMLALTAGVAIASPACAARVYDTGYPRAGYPPPPPSREVYVSAAARTGYRDGVDAGRDDARHRDRALRPLAHLFGCSSWWVRYRTWIQISTDSASGV